MAQGPAKELHPPHTARTVAIQVCAKQYANKCLHKHTTSTLDPPERQIASLCWSVPRHDKRDVHHLSSSTSPSELIKTYIPAAATTFA
jgi:hypothetical protein